MEEQKNSLHTSRGPPSSQPLPPNPAEVLHTRSTGSEDKCRRERSEAGANGDTVWKRFKNDSPSRLGGDSGEVRAIYVGRVGEGQDHVTAGTEGGNKRVGDFGSSFDSRYDVQFI